MGGQSSKDVSTNRTGHIQVIPISHPSELEHHQAVNPEQVIVQGKEKANKKKDTKGQRETMKFFVPDPLPDNNDYIRPITVTVDVESSHNRNKLPIVYSTQYDISFFQLEKILHRFDAEKYGKVFRSLSNEYNFTMSNIFSPSHEVSESDLLKVHTKKYLDSLSSSSVVASIAEVPPLAWFPNSVIQRQMLTPMRYATEGTRLAAKLALQQYGWAINLGGGYHHAKTSRGEGFCVFADIPLSVYDVMEECGVKRVLIVDLDAHQGNGFQTLYTSPSTAVYNSESGRSTDHLLTYNANDNIQIFDMYNGQIYPQDRFAQQFITYDYPFNCKTKDFEYLDALSNFLPAAINACTPDIVYYNAGTDIYEDDPLGSLSISREGIIARDEIVFRLCRKRNIPIVMMLSGGYTLASADIIASSIKNLHEKDIISLSLHKS